MLGFFRKILREFGDDECGVRAAALAYYTIFALPPLLILLILIVGLFWDPAEVQLAIETQFSSVVGLETAASIHDMLAHSQRPGSGGIAATVLGIGALIFSALGVFMELRRALNRAWEVRADPAQRGWKPFVMKRILSLAMILALAFLMIVSLVASAILRALQESMTFIPIEALRAAELGASFAVVTVLLAAIFKVLPDAIIAWGDVWLGALVTSLLLLIGKFGIAFLLSQTAPGDAYGTASALAVMLVWVYGVWLILLFGAEFTQVWAERKGVLIQPERGAIRMTYLPRV